MSAPPFDPFRTYLHLSPDGRATAVPVNDQFWTETVTTLTDGRLITAFYCDVDWDHWEVHPAGDEVVLALSGSCDFVLEAPDGSSRRTLLSSGHMLVIPRGVWHRAEVISAAQLLFITPGDGTEHRPV